MATCPTCGYVLDFAEQECPRCKRQQTTASEPAAGAGAVGPALEQHRAEPSRPAMGAGGAVAGAVYGAISLVVIVLVDSLVFGGSESRRLGLLVTLASALLAGAVLGAGVGAVTAATRSVGAGTALGAVVVGLLKGAVMARAGGGPGFSLLALLVGLLYGAVLGWSVGRSTLQSVKAK